MKPVAGGANGAYTTADTRSGTSAPFDGALAFALAGFGVETSAGFESEDAGDLQTFTRNSKMMELQLAIGSDQTHPACVSASMSVALSKACATNKKSQ